MVPIERLRPGAPCQLRWAIYQQILSDSLNTLNDVGQLSIASAALNDPTPFKPLVDALDRIAAVGVSQDLNELRSRVFNIAEPIPETADQIDAGRQLQGHSALLNVDGSNAGLRTPEEAYAWYFKRIIEPTFPGEGNRGVDLFLRRFPLTAHYLQKIASQFCGNLRQTVARVAADQALLSRLFFSGAGIRAIHKIEASGADTHKGGKQVLFITFDLVGQTGRQKIVYKPSDVELDYRTCGDTAAVTAARAAVVEQTPFPAGASLVETINRRLPRDAPRLPTYKILPRGPGSLLEERDGRLPIEDSYGYIEFLSATPPRQPNGFPPQVSDGEIASSDWLCTSAQLTGFFRTWGRWCALARLYSWGDLHEENVIAHGKQPYPIDLEVSCTGPMGSLFGTQIVRGLARGGLDGSTAVHMIVVPTHDATGNMWFDPVHSRGQESPTSNRVAIRTNGNWLRPLGSRYLPSIVQGMREVYAVVNASRDEFSAWVDAVPKCVARFTPYSTEKYTRALAVMAYSPEYVRWHPPIPGADNLAMWKAVVDPVLGGAGPNQPAAQGTWPPNRPNRLLSALQHDYCDFANHDVPAYYHRLDSADLLNARGERVVVTNQPGRAAYFPQATIEGVRAQVQGLDDGEAARQIADARAAICVGQPAPRGFLAFLRALLPQWVRR